MRREIVCNVLYPLCMHFCFNVIFFGIPYFPFKAFQARKVQKVNIEDAVHFWCSREGGEDAHILDGILCFPFGMSYNSVDFHPDFTIE